MLNKEETENIKDDLRTLYKVLWNEHREGTNTTQETLKYINYLEQKESILDKVTDKLKEDAREEEGYIKWLDERTQEISQPKKTIIVKSDYARSILNIIEGEKK